MDSVVITETTHRLVGKWFRYQEMGPQTLKGVADPVAAYLVLDEQPGLSRFEAMRTTGRAAFMGRDREVALLLGHWESAAAGKGQLVLLSGDPGLGKSRLCDAFYRRITEQPHVRLQYQCSSQHSNAPLYPVATRLAYAADFKLGDTATQKYDKLAKLLSGDSATDQDIRVIASLLGIEVEARDEDADLTPAQRRERTLGTLVRQFDALTRRQPVIVLVEDAQWSDPTTEELIGRMVALATRLPAMVLVTFRPEYKPSWAQDPIAIQLALNRLDRSEVVTMLSALAGAKVLPDAAVEHIVARADGVPLFIEELFEDHKQSALLIEEPTSYRMTRDLDAQAVPATLQNSLMAQIDRIPSAKSVAQSGAVIGRQFNYALLAAVAHMDETSLRRALGDLVSSGVLSVCGEPPDADYTFTHDLVQGVAYNSMLRTQRQATHVRIGLALVKAGAATSAPDLVARHFEQASEVGNAPTYQKEVGDRRKTTATDLYWQSFAAAVGIDSGDYDAISEGDGPAMADEMAALVLAGTKRATVGLLRGVTVAGEPMPRIGGHVVVVDGRGEPRCVWRTTEVTVKPLIEVDDAFPLDEGEGHHTRGDWLDGHRRYFTRQAAREGFAFDDTIQTVFERFTVVWPPEAADGPRGATHSRTGA